MIIVKNNVVEQNASEVGEGTTHIHFWGKALSMVKTNLFRQKSYGLISRHPTGINES